MPCPLVALLKKCPLLKKLLKERCSAWGSGWRNSDHHPKAVILPLGRACPGEIRKGRRFGPAFPLEPFPRRPLFAEDRREADWETMVPPATGGTDDPNSSSPNQHKKLGAASFPRSRLKEFSIPFHLSIACAGVEYLFRIPNSPFRIQRLPSLTRGVFVVIFKRRSIMKSVQRLACLRR